MTTVLMTDTTVLQFVYIRVYGSKSTVMLAEAEPSWESRRPEIFND